MKGRDFLGQPTKEIPMSTIAMTRDDSYDGLVLPSRITTAARPSRRRLWTGRVLSGLVVAFLLFDAAMKVVRLPVVVEASRQVGFSEASTFGIGVVLLACVITYLVPRLSLMGAVLLTGYLGGAVATNVRIGAPLLSHTLFPLYVAALVWGGLYLRDARVRALFAPRRA
ncbi:MAG TPA: DoxX family protein [Polyangia bacterium]|nr:DoxX family protein [Polyangia bacterium]